MSKQIWRILVFSLTLIILAKPIGADSSEIGGAQAVFAPVTRFVFRFQRKMAHIEAYQVYKYSTDEWNFYWGGSSRTKRG